MSGPLRLLSLGMLVAFAGLAPMAANAAAGADKSVVYRWTDEQGVVHYGDRIPPNTPKKSARC